MAAAEMANQSAEMANLVLEIVLRKRWRDDREVRAIELCLTRRNRSK